LGASGGAAPHRLLAVLGLPPLVVLAAATLAAHPPLRGPSLLALGLYGAAALAGERGLPPPATVLALVAGLGLACGGASALNHVPDRDIDRLMGNRTRTDRSHPDTCRPPMRWSSASRSPPSRSPLLAALANLLAAALALAGGLFYVLVYTRWLERSTPQNIVIGGAAGAMPPLAASARPGPWGSWWRARPT
jgi:heme o synthase